MTGFIANTSRIDIVIAIVGKQFAVYNLKIYITPERMRNLQTYINAIKKGIVQHRF